MSSNFWNDNGRQKQEKYGKVQLELSTWIKSCNPGQCAQFIKNLDIHFCTLLSPHMSWLILKKERQYTQISLYFIAAVESVESLGRAPDKVHFLHFGLLDLATSCCLEIGKIGIATKMFRMGSASIRSKSQAQTINKHGLQMASIPRRWLQPRQLILWKCEGTKNAPGTTVFEHNAQQLVVTSTHPSRPILSILVGLPGEKQSPNHPIHSSPTAMILSSSAFSTNRLSLELDFSQNLNGFCAWNRRLLAPAKVQADCYGIDVVRSLWVSKSCIDSIAKAQL